MNVGQYVLFVAGILMLLFAVTRVSMKLSNSFQPSHKVSKQRKYSSIYPDMIQRLGDVEKVFELNEKRKNSISQADLLYDVDMNSEKKFMLDEEPAISEDEESSDSESKSNCDINSFKVSNDIDINQLSSNDQHNEKKCWCCEMLQKKFSAATEKSNEIEIASKHEKLVLF